MASRRFARGDHGQTLVEFAVASMVFLVTLFGTVEFGIGIWRYNMVADLAQEGARWASVRGAGGATHATTTDVQNYVQGRAPGFTVTVTTSPAPAALLPGANVTVVVQTTYTPLTGLIPHAAMTFQHSSTMKIAR